MFGCLILKRLSIITHNIEIPVKVAVTQEFGQECCLCQLICHIHSCSQSLILLSAFIFACEGIYKALNLKHSWSHAYVYVVCYVTSILIFNEQCIPIINYKSALKVALYWACQNSVINDVICLRPVSRDRLAVGAGAGAGGGQCDAQLPLQCQRGQGEHPSHVSLLEHPMQKP